MNAILANLPRRARVGGVHLLSSLAVAGMLLLLVCQLWYPAPFLELSGGFRVFLIIVGCDVCIGPLLTLIIAAPGKPTRELARDVGVIALVQIAAFVYGLHTLLVVRPAYVVFEAGQFVVTQADEVLTQLPAGFPDVAALREDRAREAAHMPALWRGPQWQAVELPRDRDLRSRVLSGAVRAGVGLYQLPPLLAPVSSASNQLALAARTTDALALHWGMDAAVLVASLTGCGDTVQDRKFLPLVYRSRLAAVAIAPTGAILEVCPVPDRPHGQ